MAGKPPRGVQKATGRATRRSVAERAGVAETTVSLVLNGRGDDLRIAAETQQRVFDAARDLKYVPSAAARALGSQRSRILGMAMYAVRNAVHSHVFADVVLASIAQARGSGHFVLQLPDLLNKDDVLTPIRDSGIAGLVCSVWATSAPLGEWLSRAGFPVVWIQPNSQAEPREDGPVIGIDPTPGVAALADHLWATGRRSIAILTPDPPDGKANASRIAPLRDRFGSAVRVVAADSWSVEAGRTAMADLLAAGDRPDAVFGANDVIACGALHACRAAGVSVPDEIAIAGYGDFPEAKIIDPALTTVSWPLDQLGRLAVQRLVHDIEVGESDDDRQVNLPTAFVPRGSA